MQSAAPQDEFVPRSFVFKSLLKVLLPALVGLYGVDLWVGWLDSENTEAKQEGLYVRDEVLGYTNRPGFTNPDPKEQTTINAFGLRSDEIPDDADPHEVRILGVGASQTFGAGGTPQHMTWSYHLEDQLEERHGVDLRVLNGGVMAYSTMQATRRGVILAGKLEPDLLFVNIRPGRQSMLDTNSERETIQLGDLIVPADVVEGWPRTLWGVPVGVHRLLRDQSNIYARHRTNKSAGKADDKALAMWMPHRGSWPAGVREKFDLTIAEIARLVEYAGERDIELRFVLYPETYQDSEPRWEGYVKKHGNQGAPPIGTPRLEPIQVVKEAIEGVGGKVWDLSERVTYMGRSRKTFTHATNLHWTPKGHEAIAEGIALELEREGLYEKLAAKRAQEPRPRSTP